MGKVVEATHIDSSRDGEVKYNVGHSMSTI